MALVGLSFLFLVKTRMVAQMAVETEPEVIAVVVARPR
jgi:hypothetical protein